MDGFGIALRVIGAFYVIAGYFTARAALTSSLIDQAIAAISMKKTERVEQHRTIWLLTLSVLFFAGGVCLMLLLEPAAWLFAISAAIQIFFFLFLGPYYFDVADPPPPEARQRSINAFVVFGAATLFTIWAAYTGRLTKLADASTLLWGSAAAAIALHLGYILRHTLMPPKRKPAFSGFGDADDSADATTDSPDDTGGDIADSRRIKLMADYGCYPLWAMDDGKVGPFSPYYLFVSLELENDLWAWAAEFDMSLNAEDPTNSKWTEERHRQHIEQGLTLARRIKGELPDREVFALDTSGTLIEITADDAAAAAT
jgi:hypothetical protein